jgi:SNF2 family DNA or RNA helicase
MSFETTTELMSHQVHAVAKMLPSRVGALFMDMGTGKGRTLIELAKRRQHKWDRFFWLCPVSSKQAMRDELLKHTNINPNDVCVWGDKPARADARVHFVGIESIGGSDRVYLQLRSMLTASSFVAVDESGYIKGHNAKRTRRLIDAAQMCRYRLVMTGTPMTQGVQDLWAQMRFLSDRILGYRSFHTFSRQHLEYREVTLPSGQKKLTSHVVGVHGVAELAAKMAPYVYQVQKDECLDLPEKIHVTRYVAMTQDQRALYEEAKDRLLLACDADDWSSMHIFRLFSVLQTIVCGWWRDGGDMRRVPHTRLDMLLATVREIPAHEPVIIWAKYREAVQAITAALSDVYGANQVHMYYGLQNEDQRAQAKQAWQAGGRFLVATQATGGHNLTLNEASYVIFYADGFKYSDRIQAEDRCHRIGQARRVTYVTLRCSESIDNRIALSISKKEDAVNAFKSEVDTARERGLKARVIQMVRSL